MAVLEGGGDRNGKLGIVVGILGNEGKLGNGGRAVGNPGIEGKDGIGNDGIVGCGKLGILGPVGSWRRLRAASLTSIDEHKAITSTTNAANFVEPITTAC